MGTKTKPTDEGQKLLHLTPCIACAARAQQIGMHPNTVPHRQWCAALGPWRECYNIIFSHYFFLQFLQIHRSVNLREERESCWSQSEKGRCREKEPIECWGKGRQRMGDSRNSEDTHLPWSSQFLFEVGNMFQQSFQSKCSVVNLSMTMQLHISSLVCFVVWGAFFFEDESKQKYKPSSTVPFFFLFNAYMKGLI